MKSRTWLVAIALIASLAALPSPAGAASKRHRLAAFGSCSRFVHYARRQAANELKTRGIPEGGVLPVERGPTPMDNNGTAAPQAGPPSTPTSGDGAGQDFSGTNVQEAGVDEPDTVKTDGKTMYVVDSGRLFAIDVRSDTPKLLDTLQLDGYGHELLLAGDKLLVMSGAPIVYAIDVVRPAPVSGGPTTQARASLTPAIPSQESQLQLVDVSKPTAMKVAKTMSVNGGYLSARLTGNTARVLFSAVPRVIPVLQNANANPEQGVAIGRTTTPDWRPTYKLRRGTKGKIVRRALVRCTSIRRPETFSGLNSLTVLTIDLAKGLDPVDSDGVMTDGQTVYASKNSLYVATQKAIVEQANADVPPEQTTEIHKFDISKPDETTYEGSGVVTGTLLNQYSMSEDNGLLRVATTQAPLWWSPGSNRPSESYVTVLKPDGGSLKTIGRVGELGKGERIYAVRFIGDTAYVVTFRQVDPLYTVGLADPERPKVLGSLDLLGYSAYLHPVGDGLLLGVGQSANEQGRTQGTQVSLFDVSDPAKPARLSNAVIGGGSSQAEFDPHAFLWWDPLKLALLPVSIYNYDAGGKGDQFTGAIGFRATKAGGVSEVGRVSHPKDRYGYAMPVSRSVVVGDRFFTVSSAGVLASDLENFSDRGFVAFPQQPNSGGGTVEPGQTGLSAPATSGSR